MTKKISFRIITALVLIITGTACRAQYESPADHVYQYSVEAGGRTVYLWVPPHCKKIRGLIVSMANLLERKWLEDPLIRKTAADIGLGIIWIGPAQKGDRSFTADMRPGMELIFQHMMDELAETSGYEELRTVPVIPMGHSANGQFAWTFAEAFPDRTIAAIPIKTVPLPDSLAFKNIPLCYIVGETTEWPQYRVPDPATKPGDRDFYWPVVRKSALSLRKKDPENLVGVVTDPGGGHFDWSPRLARFVALYIRTACQYRLSAEGKVLKYVTNSSGWLTASGGMVPDSVPPAPAAEFRGGQADGYWFFDRQTGIAAAGFEGDRIPRKKQMLTFVQDGQLLPVAKLGYAPLKFEPMADGLSFELIAGYLSEVPRELIGSGEKLGHADGPVKFSVANGPAVQTGPNTFRVQFDRAGQGGEICIQEEQAGDDIYRHAVQPGMIRIPARLENGKLQQITFLKLPDVNAGTNTVPLEATSDAGIPVKYYVISGPAYISGNNIILTDLPERTRFPVRVRVVAYQWGRTIPPLIRSAEPIEQTFYITK